MPLSSYPKVIPLLKSAELIVVTGELAFTAIERLLVDAATGGLRCAVFCDCVYIDPVTFAAVMRGAAQDIGEPSIINPLPSRAAALIRRADLHIVAPANTGNNVWLIPRDGNAFSVSLPAFDPRECKALVPQLLAGAKFDDARLARPRLVRPVLPTHPGTPTRGH